MLEQPLPSLFDLESSEKPPFKKEILSWISQGAEVWNERRNEWQRPLSLKNISFAALPKDIFHDFDLSGFNLEGCDFSGFEFSGTSFRRALAPRTKFVGCSFEEVDFYLAALSNSDFSGSKIWECRFRRSELTGSILVSIEGDRANFSRANLSDTLIENSVFEDCDFSGANFVRASLNSTNFAHTNFHEARLLDTDVYFTRLGNAKNLSQKQIDLANGDVETSLPPNLLRPKQWVDTDEDLDRYDRIVAANEQVVANLSIVKGRLKEVTRPNESPEKMEGAFGVLRREVGKIEQRGRLSNISPEVASSLEAYAASLTERFTDLDRLLFCAEGAILSSVFQAARPTVEEADRELAGLIDGILGIHSVLSSSVEEWRNHQSDTFDVVVSAETVSDFKSMAAEVLCVMSDNRTSIAPEVIETLEDFMIGVDSDRPAVVKIALSYLKDVFLAPLKYFAEFGRRTAEKFLDKGSEQLAKTLASSFKLALGGGIVLLAAKYPAIFGPIQKLFELGISFWK